MTVIIVNLNGERYLASCLESLRGQSFAGIEVILVDNGSTDGSLSLVGKQFPEVQIIPLQHNMGFSVGNNVGIRHARGRYVALLNNDTEAHPRWIEELVSALTQHPDSGFCASKIILHGIRQLADACGDFYTIEGIPGKIGHLEPHERHDGPDEVFGACAGAAIYRRDLLEQTGGFDEDFFINHEDSDLSFRARLLGHKCLYVPTAIVYHHLGGTIGRQSDSAVYYAQRNMEFVFFKNMPTVLLLKYLPLHILANLLIFFRQLLNARGWVFLRAKLDALTMMPQMLRKRHEIQRTRRVPATEIDRLLVRGYLWGRLSRGLRRNSKSPPL